MDEFILMKNFQIDANDIDWLTATKKAITPLVKLFVEYLLGHFGGVGQKPTVGRVKT